MTKENLIHVKLDYSESFNVKRSLLSMQAHSLRLAMAMENYKISRARELELKENLRKKMTVLKSAINQLGRILPKNQIPKSRKSQDQTTRTGLKTRNSKARGKSIEFQLMEIQNRLDELQRKNSEI